MRARTNSPLAEAHGKELGAVRIGLLGSFSISVRERKVEESAWRFRKAASPGEVARPRSGAPPPPRAGDGPPLARPWQAGRLQQPAPSCARCPPDFAPTEGSRYLASGSGALVLCPGGNLWADVEAFEKAAQGARRSRDPAAYRAALDLYGGELLPEDRYEDWAEGRRQQLAPELFLALLIELAEVAMNIVRTVASQPCGTAEGGGGGAHPRGSARGPDAPLRSRRIDPEKPSAST